MSGGTVDLQRCQVERADGTVALTPREVALLRFLAARPDQAIERAELLREVWDNATSVRSRATDNAFVRLRAKVEAQPDAPRNLLSVRGAGYRFVPEGRHAAVLPLASVAPQLVGRDAVLDIVREVLLTHPLATITGGPGLGKSAVAQGVASGWPYPVVRVDLAGSRTEAEVRHAAAWALGLHVLPR